MAPRVSYEVPDVCPHCGWTVIPETRKCASCGKRLDEQAGFAWKKLVVAIIGLLVVAVAGLWVFSDELEQARLQNLQKLEDDAFWRATRSTLTDHFGDAVNDRDRPRSQHPDTASTGSEQESSR